MDFNKGGIIAFATNVKDNNGLDQDMVELKEEVLNKYIETLSKRK